MNTIKKPILRETAANYRGKPLMIIVQPHGLEIRVKHGRETVVVDYAAIYELGQKIRFRLLQPEKHHGRGGKERGAL